MNLDLYGYLKGMKEMEEKRSDLISREALLKKYCKKPAKGDCEKCDWYGDSWCRCEIFGVQIAEAPAVDAVEVVRCKDCRYWQDNNGGYPHKECRWGKDETPDATDFCSYAERKE